jgi:preprotein translocase subunit SecD
MRNSILRFASYYALIVISMAAYTPPLHSEIPKQPEVSQIPKPPKIPAFICYSKGKNKARPPASLGLFIGGKRFGKNDIIWAQQGFQEYSGSPMIDMRFSPDAALRFAKLTTARVNKNLPIFWNGALLSCPRVLQPILGGEVQINGNFTVESAKKLARNIQDIQ